MFISCEKREQEYQVSSVSFTPCQQSVLRSNSLSGKADVEFTSKGVQITHYNFEVACDFTTVNVTHTFVNGVLNITQQGDGDARCMCYTDVSYTIGGVSQNEVNVIFINGKQIYCYNDKEEINVQYIRRYGHYKDIQNPVVSVISAKSKLEQYFETHVKCIYNSYTGLFLEATKIYSDNFFAKNYLVIVLLEEGSGSIRHKVEKIDNNGDITISRLIPQVGTCDMAEWNIVIELDNNFSPQQFRAVLVDKYLTEP